MSNIRSETVFRLFFATALIAAIILAAYYRDSFDVGAFMRWIEQAGIWAPFIFCAIYVMSAVLFLPGSALTLAGGAMFGPVWGMIYSLTGATLGASLAFLIARYMASDWVERKVGGKLKKLYDGVEEEGWRFVAFTRLVPVFPFNLLNYALGLTRIKFSHYVIATFIFMAPGGIAYTYLGYAGKEALAGGEGLIQKGLMALGLLALAAFLPRFITRMRKVSNTDRNQPCDLPVNRKIETQLTRKDRKHIEKSILRKYVKVAASPEGLFKYPTGPAGLETLRYNRDYIRALPDIVAASYCGVGNPFSLGSISRGSSVLDIGCGAGVDTILAAMMAGPDGKAVGVDMSPQMLARARDNAREAGLDNITFKEASAEELPFADGVFDVVISNGVFNLIVDKYKALKEVFRTLKPGGRLMMADQTLINSMPEETAAMVKNWGR